MYRVVDAGSLGDDRRGVRALLASWPPGERDRLHSHPTSIWYAVTDANLQVDAPGAPPLRRVIASGASGVQGPVALHSVHNVGDRAAEILIFELGTAPPAPPAAGAGTAPAANAVTQRFQALEEHGGIRLLRATFEPGVDVPLHSHPASLRFALTDVRLRVAGTGFEPFEIRLKAGQAQRAPPVRAHTVTNLGDSDAEFLLLE